MSIVGFTALPHPRQHYIGCRGHSLDSSRKVGGLSIVMRGVVAELGDPQKVLLFVN
jgi:hypothetical protein